MRAVQAGVTVPIEIPDVVIDRLPLYYRLRSRLDAESRTVVSSQELGEELGVTPAQIRKDLSYFGRFGKQGRGYSVSRLLEELKTILGLDGLGRAIASYPGFEGQGFDIIALYDAAASLVGTEIEGQRVRDVAALESDLKKTTVDIGIVAVPGEFAQDVVDTLVESGVHAILNYTPNRVQTPPNVEVRHINPVLFLQSMTYHLKQRRGISPG